MLPGSELDSAFRLPNLRTVSFPASTPEDVCQYRHISFSSKFTDFVNPVGSSLEHLHNGQCGEAPVGGAIGVGGLPQPPQIREQCCGHWCVACDSFVAAGLLCHEEIS